jgi:hypothetical protein
MEAGRAEEDDETGAVVAVAAAEDWAADDPRGGI